MVDMGLVSIGKIRGNAYDLCNGDRVLCVDDLALAVQLECIVCRIIMRKGSAGRRFRGRPIRKADGQRPGACAGISGRRCFRQGIGAPGELQDLESIESFEKVDEDRLTVSEAIALRLVWMATSNIEYADRIRAIRTLIELCPSESEDVLVLTKDSITFDQLELILDPDGDAEPVP